MRNLKRLVIGAGIALSSGPAFAGPTIIRDTRVKDIGATPVLGRGYSMATNTFQSACLKDVVVTEPSYDFQYLFQELETSNSSSSDVSVSGGGSYSSWWIRAEAQASVRAASRSNRTAHSVVVRLNMDTYYASVNESGTPLSESAAALLEREDLPGFFAACGPYYIRGINRNAQLVSLFTYETTSSARDFEFEARISGQLKGFFGGGSFNSESKGKFTSEAASKNLTITTRGWGLGKQEEASLVSYDLDTFKQAVKQAFISMQNPLTGRVMSVEIVPWVENTDFQNKLNMSTTDIVSGRTVPLYEKKDILTMNGEFLAEMERASRARLNAFYTAKMCKNHLLSKWSADGKTLLPDIAKQQLKNHRLGPSDPQPITAEQLLKAVDDGAQKGLWDEYSKFTFASNPSVRSCVAKLMADPNAGATAAAAAAAKGGAAPADDSGIGRGIFLKRYLEHDDCVKLQSMFVPARQNFEEYCMPELVNQVY
jgi:hypothetical protein